MNGLSKLPVGGLGAFPQNIFVVTCSEIDSNAIWLRVLVVKPHLHLKMSYKMRCDN